MNKIVTPAAIIFTFLALISILQADAGPLKYGQLTDGTLGKTDNGISWSGWNNYPNTNIFYRVQILDENTKNNSTFKVEVMSNYRKDVSFAIALNDADVNTPYFPVYKLHKNKTTIVDYPKPKNTVQIWAVIKGLEVD